MVLHRPTPQRADDGSSSKPQTADPCSCHLLLESRQVCLVGSEAVERSFHRPVSFLSNGRVPCPQDAEEARKQYQGVDSGSLGFMKIHQLGEAPAYVINILYGEFFFRSRCYIFGGISNYTIFSGFRCP